MQQKPEFVIGPLFLTARCNAFWSDHRLVGLRQCSWPCLSWRYLTRPRLPLKKTGWHFLSKWRKICWQKLVTGYNLANGILFLLLAGAMITYPPRAGRQTIDRNAQLTDTPPMEANLDNYSDYYGALISWLPPKLPIRYQKQPIGMSPVISWLSGLLVSWH